MRVAVFDLHNYFLNEEPLVVHIICRAIFHIYCLFVVARITNECEWASEMTHIILTYRHFS